jgi:hypothetical protein
VANIFNDTQKHLVMTRHLENGLSMLPRKVKDLPGIAGLCAGADEQSPGRETLSPAGSHAHCREIPDHPGYPGGGEFKPGQPAGVFTLENLDRTVRQKFNSLDILTDYCILLNYCTTLKCLSFFLRYFPREISDYSLRSRRFIFIFV